MSVQQITLTQIVCRTPNGTLTHSVSCSPDAAADEIRRARRAVLEAEKPYARFTGPAIADMPQHPLIIPFSALDDVIAIYGQTVNVTNDPRAAGQNRTASGVVLPA